jgi:predicted aldo/keto reductase-like oxidoreductase
MDCPSGVDIPRVFTIANHYRLLQGDPHARAIFDYQYRSLSPSEQAHNCTACKTCLDACPQRIPIPDHMAAIAVFAAEK